jgi:hypothetical protein
MQNNGQSKKKTKVLKEQIAYSIQSGKTSGVES